MGKKINASKNSSSKNNINIDKKVKKANVSDKTNNKESNKNKGSINIKGSKDKGEKKNLLYGLFNKNGKKTSAVKRYNKNKKKKDKKKKLVNGKFTLDILDLLIIVIITVILSCVLTGLILNFQFKKSSNLYDSQVISDKNVQDFLSTYSEIIENYYEEVDKDALMKAAMDGMLSFLEEKYSIYLEKNESDELVEMLDSSYEGIGIVVAGVLIDDVYKDSPAEKAGFEVGDEIVEINGSTISMDNYEDIGNLISLEEENTFVVLRDNKKVTLKVSAGTITIPTTSKNVFDMTNSKIGYIKLDSFSSMSFEEFQDDLLYLENKEKIDSLIIDLRGNSGGYLNSAYNIASLFIEKGKVIYSLESKNKVSTYKDKTSAKRKYDIVVLVNSNTASAAEILTAALHDSYGAIVVGNTTYGKGKVQNIKYYEDSILKYTSAKWLRPTGECIDEVGIKPDYEVSISITGNKIEDKQLDKALELLD